MICHASEFNSKCKFYDPTQKKWIPWRTMPEDRSNKPGYVVNQALGLVIAGGNTARTDALDGTADINNYDDLPFKTTGGCMIDLSSNR